MIRSKQQINKQLNFCKEILERLESDIKLSLSEYPSNDVYYGIRNHSRMGNDIIYLRRELKKLSEMIGNK